MKAILKSHSSWVWGLTILFFIVLAAITFRCCWGADIVFSASDLNIGRLASKKANLPELLTGYFTGNQVMGGSGYSFTLFHVLMAVMPLTLFADVFYALVLLCGSLSMVWFLRIWGRSWLASISGALIAFWFNSITLASSGHAYKMEVLALAVLGLCFIEKSVRSDALKRSAGFALLAGLSVGVMMIEQQDVALLAGLFVGPYALLRLAQMHLRSFARWAGLLIPVAVVALLLSGSTVMKSYERNIAGAASVQGDSTEKWNYITQWSMVPAEWPDLVAPGWGGWSTGNPDGPYRGKIGQSAEWESTGQGFHNFKLDSIYLGIIPFLLAGFGFAFALKRRKTPEGGMVLFWCVAGGIGLLLAFGKYSPLYKLFFQLPMVGNIRAPIKLLDNVEICLGIVAAFGLDGLMAWGKAHGAGSDKEMTSPLFLLKVFWIVSSVVGGLMLFAGFSVAMNSASHKASFSDQGFAPYADVILKNTSSAWIHGAVLALISAALIFLLWKGLMQAKWIALTFVLVLAGDSLLLTRHYFRADDIGSMKQGNALISFLKENQGDERTFFVDQGGIYNQWLASDGPYHGLNLFNIWQMPRMPVEYKEFLGKVGRNQIRLWELSSVKYVAAPAQIQQQLQQNPVLANRFRPVLNYQVPTAQGMRPDVLLEFSGSVPRFALYDGWQSLPVEQHCAVLASPQHDFSSTLLVDSALGLSSRPGAPFTALSGTVTKKAAVVEVDADGPSIVRFSQRYQPGWSVKVDGEPATMLRVDYLCMGVQVPAGTHTVEFRCVKGTPQVALTTGTFFISIFAAAFLLVVPAGKKTS